MSETRIRHGAPYGMRLRDGDQIDPKRRVDHRRLARRVGLRRSRGRIREKPKTTPRRRMLPCSLRCYGRIVEAMNHEQVQDNDNESRILSQTRARGIILLLKSCFEKRKRSIFTFSQVKSKVNCRYQCLSLE